MKKKWIYITLIVLLVIPILFFYNAFNGNPVWKLASTHSLKNYLKKNYPEDEYFIQDGSFNFKINGYTYRVTKGGEGGEGYEFNVTKFINPEVSYDGIYYANLDIPLMEKLQEEAAEEIYAELNRDHIIHIGVEIQVLQGTYSSTTSWSKDLKIEKPLYLSITMDVANLSKEDVLNEVRSIKKDLDQAGYDYEYVSFNGNLLDGKLGDKFDRGYVKYAVGFEKDSNISLKDITEYNQ